jgi:NADH-quinone oxidoreductase subunit A
MPDHILPLDRDPIGTLVFFLLVFVVVGVVFLFMHLAMGSVIRPRVPDPEKLTIYECGEPTVGSAWIQFDLRFYVVALLFVIFDVEVAFFFPWATVFGKANQLANLPTQQETKKLSESEQRATEAKRALLSEQLLPSGVSKDAQRKLKFTQSLPKKDEKGNIITEPKTDDKGNVIKNQEGEPETVPVMELTTAPIKPDEAATWAQIAFLDLLVFFGVLLVGFAYLWRRGDIDWVRAYAHHKEPPVEPEKPLEQKVTA